ncbi:MAG TPA: MYXO-CTERM sorting domain-containing protein [Polyangia bacterium]|nr:MYXO-CTERM sorting domain-containing protein [Polyangia bacterium]
MSRRLAVVAALVFAAAAARPARAYVRATAQKSLLPSFWDSGCQVVTIYTNGYTDMSTDEIAKSIAAAAHAWSPEVVTCPDGAGSDGGAGHPSFEIITQLASGGSVPNVGPDGQNVLVFQTETWDHNPDAIALTSRNTDPSGRIFDADIEVNVAGAWKWANLDPNASSHVSGNFDLQTALTHEFGHFLGLAHTCYNPDPDGDSGPPPLDDQGRPSPFCSYATDHGEVMWYQVDPGSTAKRVLSADDARGVCSIYPPGVAAATCAADQPDDGCGCRTSGHGAGATAAWLALAALATTRRRRR